MNILVHILFSLLQVHLFQKKLQFKKNTHEFKEIRSYNDTSEFRSFNWAWNSKQSFVKVRHMFVLDILLNTE